MKKRNFPDRWWHWVLVVWLFVLIGFSFWNWDVGRYQLEQRRAPVFPINSPIGFLALLFIILFLVIVVIAVIKISLKTPPRYIPVQGA